ncbi:MAG TPA: methyltransferase domain-containing protein [Pyrinomonadaceae bacterium]
MVALSDNSIDRLSKLSSAHTAEGVVVDIGTGDGTFVYQSARQNPGKFYIGIDPNVSPLEKISEKIHRKIAKGGAPNVLFIQSNVEDLPPELEGVADEVHVHFPWGGLLKAVASGDEGVLQGVRKICAGEALLEIIVGLDDSRDRSELNRLGLERFSVELIDSVLLSKYREAGFEITERGCIPAGQWPEFKSSWAKRLKGKDTRPITYLIARAVNI